MGDRNKENKVEGALRGQCPAEVFARKGLVVRDDFVHTYFPDGSYRSIRTIEIGEGKAQRKVVRQIYTEK